jgi:hypothetical protein
MIDLRACAIFLKGHRETHYAHPCGVAIANRDAILVQALSIELLLRDAIDQRANSGGLPELQTILARVVDMRAMLDTAVAAPVEASVGAQALSFKNALLEWWNKNHVSILDRSFNSGLLVGGLMLVAYCGLVPVATVAAAIHGKEFTEAIKALAEVMKRIGGSRD